MANIRKKVCEVLDKVGLPYGYVAKDEGPEQFIAFNINTNKAFKYFDDEEQVTLYKVTINIFSMYDFSEIQDNVEKYMLEAGFVKDNYPACLFIENVGIFNQPMYFNFYEEGDY